MAVEVSADEVRIEHSVADQRATANLFLALYVVTAAAAFVAALFRPELLLGAIAFALFLVYWTWQVRRAQTDAVPWLVVVRPEELRRSAAGVDVRIRRREATRVRFSHRPGPRAMTLYVLDVRGGDGRRLLHISLPGHREATTLKAAFERWGWPVR